MGTQTELLKKPAPTFFGIIVFKLLKGAVFLTLAIILYCLSDNNLPKEFKDFLAQPTVDSILHHLKVHPGNKFFTHLAEQSLSRADSDHQRRLVLIDSMASAGASNRPEVIAAATSHTDTVNGNSLVLILEVQDRRVTGTGAYSLEGGRSGAP